MALWIHGLSFYRLQRLNKNNDKPRADCFQDKNANKPLSSREPSGRRLANFVRPRVSLPRTTKDKPAYRCMPIIDGKKNIFKDPQVPLAVELGSWPWRLQEQAHGASARAQSQWGTQFGHRQRPHQLEDVELDGSNKAEAACQVKASSNLTSIPMLGMSFSRLPFLVGTAILPRRLKIFLWEWEMGPRETTRKNEILFYWTSTYIVRNMPSTDVLRNKSKWIILLIVWNAIGQEILANFVVR